jgi:adenylate kinase
MIISVVGTKGAGKGTQVSRLAKDFNLVSFAPGDAFRSGIKHRTPLGIVAEKYMQRGELVPDDIVNGLVEEWVWTTSPHQGIIFDGFPRTTFQAAFLEDALRDMGRTFDATIYMDVSDDEVVKRLGQRRVCHHCREEFHVMATPFTTCPKQRCVGQYLRHLDEDKPAIISTLIKVFQRGIEPLLQHYEKSGRLITINADGPIDGVHDAIVAELMRFR